MKKKIFSLIMTTCMALTLLPTTALAKNDTVISCPVTGGNFYFDTATGEVTGCDKNVTAANIPSEIGGTALTSIGDYAFYSCYDLTSITIPSSVTCIGDNAFGCCDRLSHITVDCANSNYCDVDGVLFSKDKSTIISYPSGKTNRTYTVPNSVTSIGDYTFSDRSNLTSVSIPTSVTSIGKFALCHLPDVYYSGTESDWNAINMDPDNNPLDPLATIHYNGTLVTYPVTGGALYFDKGTGAITTCDESITSADIPNEIDNVTVTIIGDCAFQNCLELTSVTIPENVTSIGKLAFDCCEKLTSVTIPNKVTFIGDGAFFWCTRLTSITIPDGVTSIGSHTFFGCSNLNCLTLPDSVTSIGDSAFDCCGRLSSLTIPKSVTFIGDYVFRSCSSLSKITVDSENLNYCDIDGILFDKNKSKIIRYLAKKTNSSYTIPDGVTSIENCAFDSCRNLNNVTIPDSVTSIGHRAFDDCCELTSIAIPGNVTFIGNSAFSGCDKLSSLSIPDSVTSIGSQAFYGCGNLSSVNIPKSVTSIGDFALNCCYSLSKIIVDKENPNYCDVDGILFNKNKSVLICYPAGKTDPSYTIPDGVISVGSEAFSYNDILISVSIPESVTSIEGCTFLGCTNLSSVTIPTSVTSIGWSAFSDTRLTDVYYSGTETQWSAISFEEENSPLLNATIHYNSTGNSDHNSSGDSKGDHGSNSGGSSSNTTTVTTANPDGSTTTTVTNKTTGAVTETTKYVDGTTAAVSTDTGGGNKMTVTIPSILISDAESTGTAIKVSMPTATAANDAKTAVPVTLELTDADSAKIEIPVENVSTGVVAVLVQTDGTETVVRTSVTTGSGVLLTVEDGATIKIVDNGTAFSDVDSAAWYADGVAFASSRELFYGTGSTTFDPAGNMTRGMLVTVLHRLAYEPDTATDKFDDVANGAYYFDAVAWAAKNDIITGYGNGLFGPDDSITREQLAAILYRYVGNPATDGTLDGFTDGSNASAYAVDALKWAVEQGIITGKGGGTLAPQSKATRAEVATILMRFCENVAK